MIRPLRRRALVISDYPTGVEQPVSATAGRPRSTRSRVVACWSVVAAVVAMLFLAPSSSGSGSMAGSLTVTPRGTYGGQLVTFSGDIGSGEQVIRLQRRGNTFGAWAPVIDPRTGREFRTQTARDGSFRFTFPSPAMNAVYFRVVNGRGVGTNAVQFDIRHQDAEVELLSAAAGGGSLAQLVALVGDPFQIKVDTAHHDRYGNPQKPILAGRTVILQVREAGVWKSTGRTTVIGRDGYATFDPMTLNQVTQIPLVYRVVLANWTQNGDDIGWFPSLPYFLNVVRAQ